MDVWVVSSLGAVMSKAEILYASLVVHTYFLWGNTAIGVKLLALVSTKLMLRDHAKLALRIHF